MKYSQIKDFEYTSKCFFNYLWPYGVCPPPGHLLIILNEKIENRKRFMIKMNNKDVLKLPKSIRDSIHR